MLSLADIENGQEHYYDGLAREDYLTNGGEAPGIWLGRGAAALGLESTVVSETFIRVFQGFHPDRDATLVQNAGKENRQPGWDLTFSAPKSVSVLFALANPHTRRHIQSAHLNAVREAIGYLEDVACFTRRGKGGRVKQRAGFIVAAYEHGTSRAQDPDLHTHALCLNAGIGEDGLPGAIVSKPVYRHKMAAGAVYRASLALGMQQIGFVIERDGVFFRVAGVPHGLCDRFSTRSKELRAFMKEQGVEGPAAAAWAAVKTRQVKGHVAREVLFMQWAEIAATFGFSRSNVIALRGNAVPVSSPAIADGIIADAVHRLSLEKSHFPERDFLQKVAEAAAGTGLSVSEVRALTQRAISGGELVPLGEVSGERRFTTKDILASEARLLRTVGEMNQQSGFHISDQLLARAIGSTEAEETVNARERDPSATPIRLSQEQHAALRHIADSRSRIVAVSGMAGTGKSAMLGAARRAWERGGYRIIGAAVSGKAARGLARSSGIDSITISRLLYELGRPPLNGPGIMQSLKAEFKHATWQIDSKTRRKLLGQYHKATSRLAHEWKYMTWQISRRHRDFLNYKLDRDKYKLDNKTVLVIDEAGMVGTRQMERLLQACAHANCKVVLVGDERQLQPVEPGGPFYSILNRIGCARLSDIVRQGLDAGDTNPAWKREASRAMAEGRAGDALRAYSDRGFFYVAQGRKRALQALIRKWAEIGLRKPESCLIMTGKRREADELNRLAQDERRRAGRLGLRFARVGAATFYELDRVVFTRNSQCIGVMNGDFGTVTHVDNVSARLKVQLDSGAEVAVPFRRYMDLSLGYASTTHKAQGATVDHAYVLCGGPMADRELSYVQASRARLDTHFFSEALPGPDSRKEQRAERTINELARIMSRSRQKDLAHDVLRQPTTGPEPLELTPIFS
ncbi:MAG: relaxase domain-containing protein [Armatimonadetes bacterium]|nr:relaxase domain-containing protein [Armatimonadota bacterium]MDE2205461.1 relaxase domain-containing protein [Armatimonadota bacterium]